MAKIISFINMKGGVGKTSLSINIADKLSQTHKVLVIDVDPQFNATAGYVYIISNIGSFGPDVIKIGVTRRLDPMDRIDELGSASVPFKFDVHALIFSYDAYALESELHQRFDKQRVNKVNNRKEYFRVPITEIKKVLEEYKDLTVDFNETPDAPEYRESLAK